jgi:hypothetical protein
MYFNVFEAAPENERDGPPQQAAQNAGGKVSATPYLNSIITSMLNATSSPLKLPEYFL